MQQGIGGWDSFWDYIVVHLTTEMAKQIQNFRQFSFHPRLSLFLLYCCIRLCVMKQI
jgi:hypothetical protein